MKKYMEFFPFGSVRPVQDECMVLVDQALNKKEHLILNAATGIGKTAATLVPAISYALANKKTVFFLTSRTTQHQLALDTIRLIKQKSKSNFLAADIVGKQSMCSISHVEKLYSSDFSDFCRRMREERKCEYYENTRKQSGALAVEAKIVLEQLKVSNPVHLDEFLLLCRKSSLCPYEIATAIACESQVIVADHYHIFHPRVLGLFLAKTKKELADSILIVDEAHNLPQRIRDTLTSKISSNTIRLSLAELKKEGLNDAAHKVLIVQAALNIMSKGMREGEEKIVLEKSLSEKVSSVHPYDSLVEELSSAAESVRGRQQISHTARIADFLVSWKSSSQGYARIVSLSIVLGKQNVALSCRCLDPNMASGKVIDESHSTILMSGTLSPTFMYRDLLGFPKTATEASFACPFPKENRLALIVPKTTTKFTHRSDRQFAEIASVCSRIIGVVPGNVAVFFPSYSIRDSVVGLVSSQKPFFLEQAKMTKQDRKGLLEEFRKHRLAGAVLFATSAGSFGEGVDLPGDLLNCVVVVGLPFKVPDLETKELIKYYDKKFGKGLDYGYILPAVARVLQNAGRCIRSETDRGVIVFLDERYLMYRHCFPKDWNLEVSTDYSSRILKFFSSGSDCLTNV
jgi:DNA excision repair protein ERCC-2